MNGDVTINLGGEALTLKCTLEAAMVVDETLGGFAEAMRQVSNFKLSGYVAIIAAGLGRKQTEIREAVFREGLTNLVGPVTEYTTLLANGGRKPEAVAEAAKTGEG